MHRDEIVIEDDTKMTLARLDALAQILDSAFTIPGTRVTMGVDAALGLIPVIGDIISGMIGGYLILEARRLGASRLVLTRMAANTAIDSAIGSVPFVGDVFDVAFRANRKNVDILKRHIEKNGVRRSDGGITIDGNYTVQR